MKLQKKFFASKPAFATAFAVGVILAVSGSVLASSIGTNLSVSGTATITGASTLTGLGTMTAGYVSQASSTVVGAFTVNSALSSFNSGFISAASSTVVGNLTLTGIRSATSTWLASGFISPASSTVSGAFTVGVGNLTTLDGGYISNASSTVVGNLTLTGISSATSTWISAGFISRASSTVVGALTASGGIGAADGAGTTQSPRLWHTGNTPATATTTGLSKTPVTTETYIAEVFIPVNATLTGVAVFNSSAVAGNMAVALANRAGIVVASSASTAVSGTEAYQRVDFSSTYAAVGPATYYILVQNDSTSNRFRVHSVGNFGASVKTSETYGTFTTITVPTTFTTNVGPIASLY